MQGFLIYNMQQRKKIIIIGGPTAVGKTAVAIETALHFGTEIISADSRQCYRELNIGVARPSAAELRKVPHHFIASHSVTEKINAAYFENWALQKVQALFQQYDTVVMVGGTGLYIKAFCEGFDAIPEIPASIRESISNRYEERGLQWLQDEVQQQDPLFYASGEIKNPHRLMRALEVMEATGSSITAFQKGNKETRDFDIEKIGLELPRELLYDNINRRVDSMMEAGLPDEARSLLPYRSLQALNTVGYKELFQYFDGAISLDEAVAAIKQHTRQYAKRQLTWFKKDPEFQWIVPGKQPLPFT